MNPLSFAHLPCIVTIELAAALSPRSRLYSEVVGVPTTQMIRFRIHRWRTNQCALRISVGGRATAGTQPAPQLGCFAPFYKRVTDTLITEISRTSMLCSPFLPPTTSNFYQARF